ncbi:MAG: hypothetical protein ACRD0Q_06740 [Acidimicrobiales bacterium]
MAGSSQRFRTEPAEVDPFAADQAEVRVLQAGGPGGHYAGARAAGSPARSSPLTRA